MLCLTLFFALSFQQVVPQTSRVAISFEKKIAKAHQVPLEELYGPRDIFGLFEKPAEPAIKTLDIPKAPQFNSPTPPQAPKNNLVKLAPPLSISMSGIIFSPKRIDKSVVMVSDETNKEAMYHVGDKIKDGIIIKIGQDRIVILRSNGQQETFFLRKNVTLESLNGKDDSDSNASRLAVEKSENNYELSKEVFCSKIQSVGDLLKEFDLSPVYSNNQINGFRIYNADQDSFAASLGIKEGDILLAIHDIPISDMKSRMNVYELFTGKDVPKEFSITLRRDKQELKKQLTLVEKHRMKMPTSTNDSNNEKTSSFTKPQKKSSRMTDEAYTEMIESMRKQLADNVQSRAYASRIR
jgi:type II secretion system protein C